ncbi:MAG: 50S ribosomal protein L9 [Erysipelothrix sp.]|jgi:large subunit ribosomal protein L9|nr:50S ribosomal protein L9 [Erysipelothrix sp.]
MKVILLQDVKNYGKKGEIIEAADGYARNFLIPKGLAVDVNKQSMNQLKQQKETKKAEQARLKEEAISLQKQLKDIVLDIPVKTGEEGRVFGSVSTKQIIEEMEKKHQIKLDKRKMKVDQALNTLGMNRIVIDLYKDVEGIVSVRLVEKK